MDARVRRVTLVSRTPSDERVAAVFDGFRREGREPIALYRALAHTPALLQAYGGLARGLRHEAVVPRALRELVILRTAQLSGSDYEWSHHRPMAAAAGVADGKVRALARWRDSGSFDARERAVLRCAEEMHELALTDAAYAAVEEALGTEQAVEIVLVVAFYQAVARLIQALGVEVEPEYRGHLIEVDTDVDVN